MRKRIIVCLTALAFTAIPLFSLTLDVEQAVDYALKGSRTLQSAGIDLEISKADSKSSWNGLLPTVRGVAQVSRSNENPYKKLMPTIGDPTTSLTTGFALTWNFTPALITKIELAREQYAAGTITWEDTIAQTKRDVQKLFYAILLQQESVELQKQTLENTKERMDQTQNLYEQGYATELSVLQTQVGYENLKATVLKAEQAVEQQKRSFAFLLGLDEEEELTLVGKIAPTYREIDSQECYRKITARKDVAKLNQQMRVLDVQKKLATQSSFYPALSFSASWYPTLGDMTKNWGNKDNWSDNGSISIGISWDLTAMLPWSSSRQSVRTIEQNKQKIQLGISTLEASAKMEITNLLATLSQAKDAIESSERSITLATKSYEMTDLAYQNGTKELLDVRDSEQQLAQAKLGKLSEEYNYLSALLDLEYAVGTTFGEEKK